MNDVSGGGGLEEALELQVDALTEFHRIGADILGPDRCASDVPPAALRFEKNFFSCLFLAVTRQLVGPSRYMPLYAMVNQGMRTWVTACDNLLDDEDKEVFWFDLPGVGSRTRSVLALLLADRIVSEFVISRYDDAELAQRVGRVSLQALLSSAIQEGEEEHRRGSVLSPAAVLDDIHRRKTGDLFAAPLALPVALENPDPVRARAASEGLQAFGLACQIIDDIKDMPGDIQTGRHNLIVSLVTEAADGRTDWLTEWPQHEWTAWERFGATMARAAALAGERFERSFDALGKIGLSLSEVERSAIVASIFGLLKVPPEIITFQAGPV